MPYLNHAWATIQGAGNPLLRCGLIYPNTWVGMPGLPGEGYSLLFSLGLLLFPVCSIGKIQSGYKLPLTLQAI